MVEEVIDCSKRVLCCRCLLCADGAKGAEELVVACLGIVQEAADNCLYSFDTGSIKWWTGVNFNGL